MFDLKQYRMTDWKWYEKYKLRYGAAAFENYRQKVNSVLECLLPGHYYDLQQAADRGSRLFVIDYEEGGVARSENNQDLFVKLVCGYIINVGNIYFSDDYTKIYRSK